MRGRELHESINASHRQETGFPHSWLFPDSSVQGGHLGLEEEEPQNPGRGCGLWSPVTPTQPPRLAAMSQHTQACGAAGHLCSQVVLGTR